MPHLDFVALREPVTCTLPTDAPGTKRLIRQFRRLELEQYQQADQLRLAGDIPSALAIYGTLCKYAVEGLTDDDLNALALPDMVRLLGAAMGKLELVEAALGNASRAGVEEPITTPVPIPASTTTTLEAPLSAG